MRDRTEQILRVACLILATLVLAQLIRTGFHVSPFFGVRIPAIPILETNTVSGSSQTPPTQAPTVVAPSTNVSNSLTNVPLAGQTAKIRSDISTNVATNLAAIKINRSNLVPTNVAAFARTNFPGTNDDHDLVIGTNPPPKVAHRPSSPMMMPGGMGFGGMPGMPGSQPALPPEVQARVDKIINSEIFAPIMHPLPMGLMGIAGDTAFLRADNGQTGLVKVGDSLGDVKLLAIGINRVLVEQGGQKKELTIFDGYGSDSLLSQTDKSSK